MTDAAGAIVGNMNLADVAMAMQNDKEESYLDEITNAEATAYVTSGPYIQHLNFASLTRILDTLSGRFTRLQQHLYDLKDAVAKTDQDMAATLRSAQAFAMSSDDPNTVMDQLSEQIKRLAIVTSSVSNWPFQMRRACTDEVLTLQTDFEALAGLPGYSGWKNSDGKDRVIAFSAALNADLAYINGLNPDNSDRITAVAKAQNVLAHFEAIYTLRDKPELTQIEEVFACKDHNRKADYTLIVNDLTANGKSANVSVVTLICIVP